MELINFFLIILFSFFFGCSMYGWSTIQLLKKKSELISINIVLGMSIILIIGGIFNAFNISNTLFINLLLLFGFIFFLISRFKKKQNKNLFKINNFKKKYYFLYLIPFILYLIHIVSVINIDIYNYHDDLQKYFVHPFKMLQTGSFFGSTLSSLGRETLGGQAFFQSFYVNWFGIHSINIFDSLFCLSIICLLIIEVSIKQEVKFFGGLILTLIILFHTQLVNVSSIYSTILFIFAIIFLTKELLNFEAKNIFYSLQNIFPICIIIVSLIVLKTSNLIFLFIFPSILLICLMFFNLLNLRIIKKFFFIFLLTILLVFPWLIFFIKQYFFPYNFTNDNIDQSNFDINFDWPNLFSIEPLFLGGTLLHYSILIIIPIIILLCTLLDVITKKYLLEVSSKQTLVIGFSSILSGVLIFVTILFLASPKIFDVGTLIRYTLPFIISCIPAGLFFIYIFSHNLNYLKNFILLVVFTISLIFLPLFIERIHQTYKCGSQLSFSKLSCSKEFIEYGNFALSEKKKNEIIKLQNIIPQDVPIMAWINSPFFLDFKRNKIIEIDIAGLDNNWAIFPSSNYMILEHDSYATRSIEDLKFSQMNAALIDRRYSIRALEHLQKIINLNKQKKLKIIFSNNSYSIFKILK